MAFLSKKKLIVFNFFLLGLNIAKVILFFQVLASIIMLTWKKLLKQDE